ncbi:MAG: hypothetical protein JWO22_1209 [Frankiales bacterium]|nr:hypothetical protein [Frankiales bacterium]
MPALQAEVVAYLDRVRASLPDAYTVEERRFEGSVLTLARRTDTRLAWAGARLTTTLALLALAPDADRSQLDRYLDAVVREAGSVVTGGGLQRGSAAVAVAVFEAAPAAALSWARVAHGHRFAVAGYPVVVDLTAGTVVQPERMRVGGLFRRHLHRVADETLSPALGAG